MAHAGAMPVGLAEALKRLDRDTRLGIAAVACFIGKPRERGRAVNTYVELNAGLFLLPLRRLLLRGLLSGFLLCLWHE